MNKYINYLLENKVPKEEAVKLLKGCSELNNEQRRLIYCYCYPRILGDYQLPTWIMGYRQTIKSINNVNGSLKPDFGETALLVEAAKTEQYGRFMKHVFHSFIVDPKLVHPVSGKEIDECPICGKKLYEHDIWTELVDKNPGTEEKENKEFLAFGSEKSSLTICLDCLIQLKNAYDIIVNKLDPTFMKWLG